MACTSPTGRVSFQPARYVYLVDWKGFLPAGEVHASPATVLSLGGVPPGQVYQKGQQVKPFRFTRMYPVDQKETLSIKIAGKLPC
jgi:hypothetical protein